MSRHALVPDDDPHPRTADGDALVAYLSMPRSVRGGHADLDDQAVADFLAGDYFPTRRYTTADWFGEEQTP
jgi:hypothetical protein